MMLTLRAVNTGTDWDTRVALDFATRRWTAQAGHRCWRRLTTALDGPFDAGAVTVLKDAGGQALIELVDAPRISGQTHKRQGDARIVGGADAALKQAALQWGLQTLEGADGLSAVRRAGLELIAVNLPPNGLQDAPNCVEAAPRKSSATNASGFRSTGCGGLAGWYFKRLLEAGFPVPQARVKKTYEWTPPGKTQKVRATSDLYLTGPTFGHDIVVKELQKARQLPVYVDFTKGSALRPRPGDVYFIRTPQGLSRHVGVFVGADETGWRTADGGGGASGYAVGIARRSFDPATASITGGKEAGFVPGWIDLDELMRLGTPA